MKIAAIVDNQGKVGGFESNGAVKIFEKTDSGWAVIREMPYGTEILGSPAEIRKNVKEICLWLEDCKVFVAEKIAGFFYSVFESFQINMWEMSGAPEDFLEYIFDSEMNEIAKAKEPVVEMPVPIEQSKGKFYLDMKEAMSKSDSFTTKQLLLPFLQKNKFDVIDVICDHIPKWFEKEFPSLGLGFEMIRYRDCVKVRISPLENN